MLKVYSIFARNVDNETTVFVEFDGDAIVRVIPYGTLCMFDTANVISKFMGKPVKTELISKSAFKKIKGGLYAMVFSD